MQASCSRKAACYCSRSDSVNSLIHLFIKYVLYLFLAQALYCWNSFKEKAHDVRQPKEFLFWLPGWPCPLCYTHPVCKRSSPLRGLLHVQTFLFCPLGLIHTTNCSFLLPVAFCHLKADREQSRALPWGFAEGRKSKAEPVSLLRVQVCANCVKAVVIQSRQVNFPSFIICLSCTWAIRQWRSN